MGDYNLVYSFMQLYTYSYETNHDSYQFTSVEENILKL